jgi:hypothetical protein
VCKCSHRQGGDNHASYHLQPCTQYQDQLGLSLHQNPRHISPLQVQYIFPIRESLSPHNIIKEKCKTAKIDNLGPLSTSYICSKIRARSFIVSPLVEPNQIYIVSWSNIHDQQTIIIKEKCTFNYHESFETSVGGAALTVCCIIHQGSTYLAILRILQKLRVTPFLLHNLKPTIRKRGCPRWYCLYDRSENLSAQQVVPWSFFSKCIIHKSHNRENNSAYVVLT